jgi:mono/diheme cytochrome c family protein
MPRPAGSTVLLVAAAFMIAAIGIFSASPAAAPQESAAPSARTVWTGVYTDAQAVRGQGDYEAHCASCHQPDLSGYRDILKGSRFMDDYREASVYRLFDKIKTTMPRGAAGSLSDQSYIDIVSYVLKSNEFPSGADELTADRMPAIMVTGKGGPEPPPDFSLVQVVGCLTRRESDPSWLLTNATDPVRAGHPQPTSAEPLADAAKPLGSSTFNLIVSAAFDPAPDAGKKVEARGFLIRRRGGSRINLTSLQALDSSCKQE